MKIRETKVYILSIAIILILTTSFAIAADDSLFYANSLELDVEISSKITLIETSSYSSVEYVTANLSFFPEETVRQEIKSVTTNPLAEIKADSIFFSWTNPDQKELILSVNSKLKTYNRFSQVKTKVKFPIEKFDSELLIYTKPTEKIDINDEMTRIASDLAEGEDDLYVVVTKIGEWVNKNIEYDLNTLTADASQKSSWVLTNKEGVCDEITNLFISMNRALGIPARFISGISYSNTDSQESPWGPHGWAEVYFPGYGWIPFDVTYAEYGYIDPTHIQCRESVDSEKSTIEYEWKAKNVNLETDKLIIETNVLKKGPKIKPLFSITPEVFSDVVDFGSYNLVKAELVNENSYYLATTLNLVKPVEVEIIDETQKTAVMKPKSITNVFWIVKIPPNLNKRKIYTFPMMVRTSFNDSYYASFSSEYGEIDYSYNEIIDIYNIENKETKNFNTDVDLNCSHEEIFVNETASIKCYARNKGNSNLKGLTVCLDKDCEIIDLLISQNYNRDFQKTFSTIGKKKLEFRIYNSQIQESRIIDLFVNDRPSIEISSISSPKEVMYEENFKLSFMLEKDSYSLPKEISMNLKGGNVVEKWKIENLDSQNAYEINLQGSMLKSGANEFVILVNFKDEKGNSYRKEERFSISLVNVTFMQRIMIFFNSIAAKTSDFFSRDE